LVGWQAGAVTSIMLDRWGEKVSVML
jgi:hypothetical protein